jgi:hypothetical protein
VGAEGEAEDPLAGGTSGGRGLLEERTPTAFFTVKTWPQRVHLIGTPASGIRASSNSYCARHFSQWVSTGEETSQCSDEEDYLDRSRETPATMCAHVASVGSPASANADGMRRSFSPDTTTGERLGA